MFKSALNIKALLIRGRVQKMSSYLAPVKEQQITIGDQIINYVSVGNGAHSVLCFPGALGTIWSDFKPQIEGLDRNKFKIIAWDPPGYGKSRPQQKKFMKNFYEKDADVAFQFMEAIGIKNYSLLGWSDGGISSMIMAAKYHDNVKKLIIWGSNAYVLPEEIRIYENIRDVNKWSDKMKAPLIQVYGKDGLQHMWNEWCDVLVQIFKDGGNICKEHLPHIKCPTLIVHGNLDAMVAAEHPRYLSDNINGAKLQQFPKGKHNLHLKYAKEFNVLVTKFLESESNP